MMQENLILQASRQGLYEITDEIKKWLKGHDLQTGLLTLFLRHTSASLIIQENVDLDVQSDIETFFDQFVPEGEHLYRHKTEGLDDMPAHIKGALTLNQLAIPVSNGALLLGQYQGIFIFEHRHTPRPREIVLHFQGD